MTAKTTTKYGIYLLSNAAKVGTCELTSEQFAKYERLAQQPEGAIILGDLMDGVCRGNIYDCFDLGNEDQNTNVVVYLD